MRYTTDVVMDMAHHSVNSSPHGNLALSSVHYIICPHSNGQCNHRSSMNQLLFKME